MSKEALLSFIKWLLDEKRIIIFNNMVSQVLQYSFCGKIGQKMELLINTKGRSAIR